MKPRAVALSIAAVAALTAPLGASPATANSTDITDPESTLVDQFPQFVDRPDDHGDVEIDSPAARTQNSSDVITVDPVIDEVPELTLGSAGLTYAGAEDSYDVFTNVEKTRSQFVRADAAGASVLSSAATAETVEELRLEFPQGVDQEATAVLLRDEASIVAFEDGDKIALREPLVYSADGAKLEASYDLDGNDITIEIDKEDLTEDAFPVVAATGFEYLSNFDIDGTSATAARNAMQAPGQFNEIFPIPGAPDDFPAQGDILPLTMPYELLTVLDFEVEMGPEVLVDDPVGYDSWGYVFYATENHIDGEGSTIRFDIMNVPIEGRGVESTLAVHGVVANELPFWIPESAYIIGAETMWEEFSLRLAKL